MLDVGKILLDGAILSLLASLILLALLRYNPRLFLQDYPESIQNQVPPKTESEKKQSLVLGIPYILLFVVVPFLSTLGLMRQSSGEATLFQLFLHAFGVVFIFNVVDLIFLDWLLFCTITPDFMVIPGTEGSGAYKNYFYHLKASLVGTVLSLVAGWVIAGIVSLLYQ
jgi:hypothetical protein